MAETLRGAHDHACRRVDEVAEDVGEILVEARGVIRVTSPRTGSRQTRLNDRFQSMAASSATVPASARRTWMVDPSGPVCMVAGWFMVLCAA